MGNEENYPPNAWPLILARCRGLLMKFFTSSPHEAEKALARGAIDAAPGVITYKRTGVAI